MFLKKDKFNIIFKNRETLTFRLTFRYSVLIFMTLVCISIVTLFSIRFYLYNQSESQLININMSVTNKYKSNGSIENSDLQEISNMNENIDVNIRKNGEIIFKTSEGYDQKIPSDDLIKVRNIEIGESEIFYYNSSFIDKVGEKIIIQTVKDMDNERDFMKMLVYILFVIDVISIGLSIIFGYLMSKKAIDPVNRIMKQAQSISVDDLSKRIDISGPDDELKKLSETFNQMIGRIEIGYERQNQFALDASHELATPLAVVKGYLDIIARWGKKDEKVLDEAIENMQKELKNITSLLDTLLFIARNDNDISEVDKEEVWMNELLVEIYKESKLIYPERRFSINTNQSAQAKVDTKLIKQMMRALIDNGVKYSRDESEITLGLRQNEEEFILSILDEGIGIAKNDISQIFDRFYRVDKARTREMGGSGLGLSIVKWIVDIHQGKIVVDSELGNGTRIDIIFPKKS